MDNRWDAIVVGGGPAGLSAALMLGRSRRRTLVVDAGLPRNRFAAHMHGVLGHEGLEPEALLGRGRAEVEAYGVEIRDGEADVVAEIPGGIEVRLLDGARFESRALVVATGITDRLADIPGLAEHWGTGVLHCPYCHGWEVRGRRLGVLALPPRGLHQTQLLRQWSDDVVMLTSALGALSEADEHRLRSRNVRLVDDPVVEVIGDGTAVTGVRTSSGEVVHLDAIFTTGVPVPHDAFLAGLDLGRVENSLGSFLAVDQNGRTSNQRIWAIGNVVDASANVPMSIGAGASTGGMVNIALVTEDFDDAVDDARHRSEPCQETSPSTHHADQPGEEMSPSAYWEGQYADNPRRWSGRVNATMADVVGGLAPGDVLELGCGEGGDAVWLAEQGWRVTAVDISPTAISRGAAAAEDRGVGDRITWVAHDLAAWATSATFDLVTASFFHSTVELPRAEILRRAAARIRPDGHLLLVSHVFETEEDIPPWAWRHQGEGHADPHSVLLTPSQEIAELALSTSEWEVVLEEVRSREATGPDGEQKATVKDGVVLLRRLRSA